MQKFFVRASDIADNCITVTGSDGVHISRSLRMAKGDTITVCDMQRREYECRIEDFIGKDRTDVFLRIIGVRDSDTEPPCFITLYQAVPKSDKMDYIVQKAVELGASEIVPVVTERTISRPDEKAAGKKLERWRKISREAAVQCGRGIVPEVAGFIGYDEAVKNMTSDPAKKSFICYEGENSCLLPDIIADRSYTGMSFMIGAEGGFSSGEIESAEKAGLQLVGLGKRILRCETASGFVLSCIGYETELRKNN